MESTLSVPPSCGEAQKGNGIDYSKNPGRNSMEGFVETSCENGIWLKKNVSGKTEYRSFQEQAGASYGQCVANSTLKGYLVDSSSPVDFGRDKVKWDNNIYSSSLAGGYEQDKMLSETRSDVILDSSLAPDADSSGDSTSTTPSFSPNYLSPLLSPQLKPSSLPSHEIFKKPYSVPVLHVDNEQRNQNSNEYSSGNNNSAYATSDRLQKELADDGIGLSGLSPSCDRRYEDLGLSGRKSKFIQPIGTRQSLRSGSARSGLGSPLLFHVENTGESDSSPKRNQEIVYEDFRCASVQKFNSHELPADTSSVTLNREVTGRSLSDTFMSSYSPFESPSLRTSVVEGNQSQGGFCDESPQKFFRFANLNPIANDSLFRSSSLSALDRNGSNGSSAPSSLKIDDFVSHSLTSQRRKVFQQQGFSGERYSSSYEDVLSAFRTLECAENGRETKESQTVSNNCSQYSSPRVISSSTRVDLNGTRSNYSYNEYSPSHIRYLNSETPSRTVLVKNIPPGVDDSELRCLLERFGPLRDLGAQQRSRGGRGAIQATYFDLRHAREAVNLLPKVSFHGRYLEVRFILSSETSPALNEPMKKGIHSTNSATHFNNGTLVVFNLDSNITADELRKVFGEYGDIKEIRESPHKKHHKFIEFYDVRDAEVALHKLNKTEVSGKKIKIEISRPGGVRSHLTNDSLFASSSYPSSSYTGNLLEEESSSDSLPGFISGTDPHGLGEYSSSLHSFVMDGFSSSERFPLETCAYNVSSSRSTPIPSSRSNGFSSKDVLRQSPRSMSSPMFLSVHSPSGNRTPGEGSALNSPSGSVSSNGMISRRSSSDDRSKFILYVEKVHSGEDIRTALMIRNIPNKYNQRMLLATLEENHRGKFDFFYLPIDFKNRCNVGYAFINFRHPQFIVPFYFEFHGRRWGRFNSEKVCEITYARIQGRNNLIAHFQNSSLMNEDPKCRPIIFGENGERLEFPIGPHVRTRRGPNSREVSTMNKELTLDNNISQ
ncbi:Protein MEI2-like 3 [Galdieria sulphuraria]|uniref:RNA-binding protein n=1 Tax=Galdieria sulphuraria TaxID=130081 RepID=M2XV37_GALSU|nr:RNA-binding protein [Galdieria sulphuraria]EME27269.1 RNA-binding protein [Galdieria sulphuraria]GJD11327.1 Protein MEI2-like 3 [Galdieria sulphuraria]|eukprot:XP_005703789.1 RNA-binding protein [Galdieria sulphuraria]